MRITKCDLCKKSIRGETVNAEVGFYNRAELCISCGKPIVDFLQKNKFIRKEEPGLSRTKKS